VGIGEATPLVTSFDFFDFVSLQSLSYLWVSGATPLITYTGDALSVSCWRRPQHLILATPSVSYTGDAFSVLAMPGAVNPLTLPWH